MEILFIAFIWLLNFAISWWNAYACGKAWVESKSAGGWTRFMVWMGAIMSAAGFTWCYLIIEVGLGYSFGALNAYWVGVALSLGYIILVPVILFAGYAITLDAWARAYREGGVLNYGIAAYDTYATYHNTASAISNFGQAFGSVADAFTGKGKSSSSDSNSGNTLMALLVLFLVVLSAVLGILSTTLIIKKAAASSPLPSLDELQRRRVSLSKQ